MVRIGPPASVSDIGNVLAVAAELGGTVNIPHWKEWMEANEGLRLK